MPFTPFHLGPGCAVKAVAGNSFSLMVFGFAQVAMDVEPLIRMVRADTAIHGFSHTFAGATLIGILSLLAGRPVCQWLLNRWTPDPGSPFLVWLRGPRLISARAAILGAFLGTYTHLLFDSAIHWDVQPLAPFVPGNRLAMLVSFGWAHLLCLGIGLLGCLGLVVRYMLDRPS
jgi:hypothetical protein